MNQERYGLPPQLFTATPASRASESRIQVDVGSTGFYEARTFRISYEFSEENSNEIASGASRWIRFTAPINFLLQRQTAAVDDGAIRARIFRAGVESGTWSSVNISATNLGNISGYVGEITVDDGGSIDTAGEIATETLRVKAASATAQQSTVVAAASDERLIIAGTYYIQLENIASGVTQGVFTLGWEERPANLGEWLEKL